MELVEYREEHLGLTEALETDEQVMAELGGAWPRDAIPGIHARRLKAVAAGMWCYTIVPVPGGPPVGMIGIFGSDLDGGPISETGWSILPAHQGRGYASESLRMLLERAQADGRWGPIHAFPGLNNGASNALCRKFGFTLVGERTVNYAGRTLRCNHWVLEPAPTRSPQRPGDRTMPADSTASQEIDAFLAKLPADQRAALQSLREMIAAAAPEAVEAISYALPAFKYRGRPLVSYGAAKAHVAFYCMSPAAMEQHKGLLAAYDTTKGSIRFQPDTPIPVDLVTTLVKARMAETDAAADRS